MHPPLDRPTHLRNARFDPVVTPSLTRFALVSLPCTIAFYASASWSHGVRGVSPCRCLLTCPRAWCSGRYSIDAVVESRDTIFRKLPLLTTKTFDSTLRSVVPPMQLAFVAVLREDDGLSRRVLSLLEHVNGSLGLAYPDSPQYAADEPVAGSGGGSSPSKAGGGGGGGAVCPYWLYKFDMAESK